MRSTRMGPGGNILSNVSGVLHNTYVGGSGVGASSISNRRAKNRRAIVRPNNITQNVIIQITRPYSDHPALFRYELYQFSDSVISQSG